MVGEKVRANEAFLHWFAGFAAGEGSFVLSDVSSLSKWWAASFSITLRDDDAAILLEIQERLQMGRINYHTRAIRKERTDNPTISFHVRRLSELLRLIEVFETYPLRARKQEDYEIWKQAVQEISRGGRRQGSKGRATYDRRLLKRLRAKLIATRAYEPSELDEEEPNDEGPRQLTYDDRCWNYES